MLRQGKFQKWGNSEAIRVPAPLLSIAGFSKGADVHMWAEKGRIVIEAHESSAEQVFDELLASEPDAAEVLALIKRKLANAIKITDKNTADCYALIERLDRSESV